MNRQLYQMGGIGTLPMDFGQPLQVSQPMMNPSFGPMQPMMSNPMSNYGQTPLTMAGGGIANMVDREKYGIGSKLKSFVRKVIPNEVAKIASVAAPFVAPFNPLLAGAMAGLGSFDQTGRIGSSLLKAGLTYGGGQAARYLGGAGFQQGFNPFAGANFSGGFTSGLGSLFTSPIGTQTGLQLGQFTDVGKSAINQMEPFGGSATTGTLSKTPGTFEQLKTVLDPTSNIDLGTRAQTAMDLTGKAIKALYTDDKGNVNFKAVISTLSIIPSYLDAKKKADEIGIPPDQFNEQVFNQEKEFMRQRYASATPDASFGITTPTGRIPVASIPTPVVQAAEGGLMDDTGGILSIKLTPAMAMGGRIDYETGGPTTPPKTLPMDLESLARRLFQTNLDNLSPSEKQYLYEFKEQNKTKKANGGRINFRDAGPASPRAVLEKKGYKDMMKKMSDEDILKLYDSVMGTFTLPRSEEAKGGIMGSEIPLRQNQGGITELDLRAKGGYIPVGIKEKADDVPAMLSRNEFVFTADAVRGAGGGNINKGAQKMYKLMKSLEKKIKKIKVA